MLNTDSNILKKLVLYPCPLSCAGGRGRERRFINPRRACAARVTVLGFSVCPLVANSLQERLFVFKPLSHTLRATKVKIFVGFSLKPLRCRDPALPPLYGHAYSRPFFHAYFSCTRMRFSRAHDTPPRVQHFSAFHYCSNNYILYNYCSLF